MRPKRLTWLIFLIIIIALAIGYGFLPKPVSVETAVAVRGNMRVTIDEEGRTRVIDRYVIYAPVAGVASRTEHDAGDIVEKGQTVIRIEPLRSGVLDPRSRAEAQARIAASESSLSAAIENVHAVKSDNDLAENELQRINKLFEDGLLSGSDMDSADARAKRTRAMLRSAEFAVEVARYEKEAALTALQYSAASETGRYPEVVLIKSPVMGSVLKVLRESEGTVHAGEPLLEIGNPAALEVEVDVLSSDAVKIRHDSRVVFERWGGDKPLEGKVRRVEPSGFTKISALGVEEQRVLVISDITTPYEEWKELGDGYRIEASFILWEDEGVLQVPGSALFRHEEGWAVFIMENNRASLRSVKTGHRNGLSAEVVSGIREGEEVITHPDSSLKDGSRVKVWIKKKG